MRFESEPSRNECVGTCENHVPSAIVILMAGYTRREKQQLCDELFSKAASEIQSSVRKADYQFLHAYRLVLGNPPADRLGTANEQNIAIPLKRLRYQGPGLFI